MERLKMQTPNMAEENFKKLKELFPEAVTEVEVDGVIKPAIDKDVLQQLICNEVVEGPKERYQFTWPGKHEAMLLAGKPTNKTLRPVKGENPIDDACFNTTENLYIEGDNLEVMKILETKYAGKIKMIYIDPPYNTGKNDNFIYKDKFDTTKQEYLEYNGERDDDGNRLVLNMESNGRFHSDWLSMMYPRLIKARNLLFDDGVIFISIDDNEVENLKKICDEIFGEINLIAIIAVELSKTQGMKVASAQNGQIVKNHEYVLVYSKKIENNEKRLPLYDKTDAWDNHFNCILEFDSNDRIKKYSLNEYISKKRPDIFREIIKLDSGNRKVINSDLISKSITINPIVKEYFYKELSYKIYQEKDCSIALPLQIKNLLQSQNILKYEKYILTITSNGKVRQLRPLSENLHISDDYTPELVRTTIRGALWKGFYSDMMNVAKEGGVDFKNGKKPTRLIKQLFKWANRKDAIILDFFSGSATTAHAVMQLNAEDGGHRKFIMVQLPEPCDEKSEAYKAGYRNICEIGKERIRRAGVKVKDGLKLEITNIRNEVKRLNEKINDEKSSLSANNDKIEEFEEKINELSDKEIFKKAILDNIDIGFRVLRLDSSNMKDVFYRPRDLNKDDLLSYTSNIKEDRTHLDLLFQAMPEIAGADYDAKIEEITISNKKVFKVNNNYIVACFEESINEEVIREIAKLKPYHAIFRDSSFPNDSLLANLEQIFRIESPDTEITVL